ncbi:MAG: MarC family protein [Bdellovibrionota bacterium]
MEMFLKAFMPLFFAIDAIGILPAFMSVTGDVSVMQRRKVVNQAAVTAFGISVFFIFFGQAIFKLLGITVYDFKVAGGILLLIFSIHDLLFDQGNRRKAGSDDTIGIVPIGTPLIIGPGALTTLLLLVDTTGYTWTMMSLTLNVAIVWVVFFFSDKVIKIITKPGAIAIGKVFALFLAAIAVMLIRSGIEQILKS